MHRLRIMFACAAFCLAHARDTAAQHIAVQEPSLETFGVGTTVSAPDRGRVSLGGVARGRASRSTYGFGPFRSRPSMGLSSQSSSVGVGVRIHDLAEMDRQVLRSAEDPRHARDGGSLTPAAERAYETLRVLQAEQNTGDGAGSTVVATGPQAMGKLAAPADAGPPAEKLLDRARQAESAGKRGLALAFLRTARDAGSAEAGKEIDRLSKKN